MGRLLFPVFGGRDPAIRSLYLSSEHDQIPDNITECWATCYWCLQACLAARLSSNERKRIAQYLRPLAVLAYQLTLPTKAELFGDDVVSIMDGMSTRYAEKLGIKPPAISDGHRALVEELFKASGWPPRTLRALRTAGQHRRWSTRAPAASQSCWTRST